MARRMVSVVLLLLTFHLTLAAGDFLCATHGLLADSTPGTVAEHSHHATPASGDEGRQTPSSRNGDDCQTPARAQCCEALASCAVTVVARDADAQMWNAGRESLPRSALLQASSVVTSPDPPPPKA